VPAWIEIAPGLRATGDGAAWLPDHAALVVADVHLGYARAARRRGGFLPGVETPDAVAERALAAARRVGATRLVLAGDLRHSTRDADEMERGEVAGFLARLRAPGALERVDVVAGNHDRGDAHPRLVPLGDVDVVHEPPAATPARWTVCGHLHPAATVSDATGAGARYPCFLAGPRVLVLPAFGAWAGGVRGRRLERALPAGGWRRLVIAGGEVFDAEALGGA
jgi:metallophosphoesterase superfamily enzyme